MLIDVRLGHAQALEKHAMGFAAGVIFWAMLWTSIRITLRWSQLRGCSQRQGRLPKFSKGPLRDQPH